MTRLLLVLTLAACTSVEAPVAATPAHELSLEAVSEQARLELESRGMDRLKWAITPFRGDQEGPHPYAPLFEAISERIGVPIELEVGENYQDLEKRIANGEVDLAVMGPYSYVRVHKTSPGVEVFSSHISRGNITYGAYIISREDSPVRTIHDLTGSRMAFVDLRSASGWLFPAARLLDAGIHPLKDMEHQFLGNHGRVVEAVMSGAVDAGATYSDVLLDHQQEGVLDLHIVAKGALVPHDAYVIRAGLPPIVSKAIAMAMAEISTRDDEGRKILAPLRPINGFITVDDSHYERVRAVDAQVEAAMGSEW